PLAELQRRFPPIAVTGLPRELRVVVQDNLAVLPATRRLTEQQQRQARGATAFTTRSGPFLAFTFNQIGHELWEGGYSWKGRVAIQARRSNSSGQRPGTTTWGGSFAPHPAVYLSYAQGTQQAASITGRLAVGPVWVAPAWTPGHPVAVDGLVQVGVVSVFASTRHAFAITIRGPIAVQ